MYITGLNNLLDSAHEWFVLDDVACRRAFLDQLADIQCVPCLSQHWALPNEPELTCDVVWLGHEDAESVLVLISGTHGVEGYCGSAVQRFLLSAVSSGECLLPNNTAVLMIHALNPWGMKWARRCDQDGIDLNRNMVDFRSLPPPENLYLPFLTQLSQAPREERIRLQQQFALEQGQSRFDFIFSGGQYHCQWGPFYGGQAPAWSSRVVEDIIDRFHLVEKKLLVVDVHTGLGPWSFGELICDHPAGSQGERFARDLFGPAVSSVELGQSFSVPKLGLQDYRWHRLMQNQGCFLTLEFGTYGTEALFDVLISDHVLWQPSNVCTESALAQQRQAMLDHFCPQQRMWQQAVLFKSWQVVQIGLAGLEV